MRQDSKQITPEQVFTNGVVYALARLIELHDQPTMAVEIFRESGIPVKMLSNCNRDDARLLRGALEA